MNDLLQSSKPIIPGETSTSRATTSRSNAARPTMSLGAKISLPRLPSTVLRVNFDDPCRMRQDPRGGEGEGQLENPIGNALLRVDFQKQSPTALLGLKCQNVAQNGLWEP